MRRQENFLGFGFCFLVFLVIFLLSIFLGVYGFFKTDLVLVFLLVLASFVGFWEILTFGMLAVFLMNWQPWVSLEMIMLLILPLGVNLGHRFLPGRPLLQSFFINFLGVMIFYAVLDAPRMLNNLGLFLSFIFADIIFGGAIFLVFSNYSRQNQ
ncbi:MAG: hypothetical protein AAB738_04130 [Patescibacteria group bacterium]